MVATITFNPLITTNASGTFNISSAGFIQGTAQNDPSARNYLTGGVLASTETLPMWGGVAVSEAIPGAAGTPNNNLGGIITRATTVTATSANGLTGFSVFDQAHAMTTTPQSPVPLSGSGGIVNFYRLGSGARIAVACDPSLVSLDGSIISSQVSWDWTNQLLVPYLGTLTISSGTYTSGTGVVVLTMSAPVTFSAGDAVVLSSLTGSGAYASLNGTWTTTVVSGSTVTLQATVGLGAAAITGGSLTLGSGASSALPVKVLDFNIGNSMTVSYASGTGFATWNRTGNAAIILI